MVELVRRGPRDWNNYHESLEPRDDAFIYKFKGGGGNDPAALFARTAALLGELMENAARADTTVLSLGSSWSFSDILKSDGWLLKTALPNQIYLLKEEQLHRDATARDRLVLASAGTTIQRLNDFLEPKLSLTTSGAHDGQTVAGMIGTGTHGSVIGYGAFQNQVRGVHLVTGAGSSVWLERPDAPCLDDAFVRRFATRLERNTDLFDAALVHLGGLGIVNAVLLEATPGYTIGVVRRKRILDDAALRELEAGDFHAFARRVWTDAPGEVPPPYYVEVILNPFRPYVGYSDDPAPALVILFFKGPPKAEREPEPRPLAEDALNLIGEGARAEALALADYRSIPPHWVAWIVDRMFKTEPRTGRPPRPVTWGDANGEHHPLPFDIELYNAAYALPRAQLREALGRMLDAFNTSGGGHLVFTLRFVTKARGHMAFTRFDETVVVNLDGLRKPQSAEAARRVALALETAGIEFSQHWGKQGVISPARVIDGFGDPTMKDTKAWKWRNARLTLLDDARMLRVVRTAQLEEWGLA